MEPDAARSHAHARLLQARGLALPPDGTPGTDILESWQRCVGAGQDWSLRLDVPVVLADDLRRRGEANEFVRRLAKAEMEILAPQIAGSNHLLVFADRDGVILDAMADNRFRMSGDDTSIIPGACWSESVAGTNGLGTALAAGQPVAVSGLEHFYLSLGGLTCTASPVRDARGDVVGVLDASTYVASRQQHTLALVQMAAQHVENSLFAYQMRERLVLAIHPRQEFLHTLSAGLLAFDEHGRLAAASARARRLLQGLSAEPGTPFEALFGEPFDAVLARAHRDGDLRLRDALGSSLLAQCRLWPRAAAGQGVVASGAMASGAVASGAVAASAAGGALATGAMITAETAETAKTAGYASGEASGEAARSARPALPVAVARPRPTGRRDGTHAADGAGEAPADSRLAEAYRLAEAALKLRAPILIQGETGVGKEWLARHLHRRSGRAGAFVAVNCAALPPELFEAELFGYVGGAFTGARRDGHAGLIASADGGTLLLDEIGELPLAMQAALLRFLDEPEVRPVGGVRARRVDVLLLAATHADLDTGAAQGRFRPDLLFRLDTVRVSLPPLRSRGDFAALVAQVLAAVDGTAALEPPALASLAAHAWPGNFRELRSVLTRACLVARAEWPEWPGGRLSIGARHVQAALTSHGQVARLASAQAGRGAGSVLRRGAEEAVRREFERSGGSVSETARRLGISRTTVYRHLGQRPPR